MGPNLPENDQWSMGTAYMIFLAHDVCVLCAAVWASCCYNPKNYREHVLPPHAGSASLAGQADADPSTEEETDGYYAQPPTKK